MTWSCKDMEASAEPHCCLLQVRMPPAPGTIRSYVVRTWQVVAVFLDMHALKYTNVDEGTMHNSHTKGQCCLPLWSVHSPLLGAASGSDRCHERLEACRVLCRRP